MDNVLKEQSDDDVYLDLSISITKDFTILQMDILSR